MYRFADLLLICAKVCGGVLLCMLSLVSCQAGMEKIAEDNVTHSYLNLEQLVSLSRMEERCDSFTSILLPDTFRQSVEELDAIPFPDDLLGEYSLVALDKTPDFRIDMILQMESDGDLFFIMGQEQREEVRDGKPISTSEKGCFIFTRKGKYVAKVGRTRKKPRGKGEMILRIDNMSIDHVQKEVVLFGYCESPLCYYSFHYDFKGRFLRKTAVDSSFGLGTCVNDGNMVTPYTMHYIPPRDNLPQLLMCNANGDVTHRALLRPKIMESSGMLNGIIMNDGHGRTYYATNLSDTVWQVTPQALLARYVLSGPTVGPSFDPYDTDSSYVSGTLHLSRKGRLCRSMDPFFYYPMITPDFLWISYRKWWEPRWGNGGPAGFSMSSDSYKMICLIDRTTNHLRWLPWGSIRIRSLRDYFWNNAKCLTTDNVLVCDQPVVYLKRTAANNQDTNILTGSEKHFIKQLPMDGNPVLLLMPLKHF